MARGFRSIVVCDFEYEIAAGDLPWPLCMVAHVLDSNLQPVRTVRLWRDEFGTAPPFDTGEDTLFVAYSAWAEMTCFHVLGWQFPAHIFDQHTAYLAASNVLLPSYLDEITNKTGKSLSEACDAYGIHGWVGINKEKIARDIGEGRWRDYGRETVSAYCAEDVRVETELLLTQLRSLCDARGHATLPAADVERQLWWANYSAKAVALIQARGMPIDPLWDVVQEHKQKVIGALLRQFDPSHDDDEPIYSPDGEWSYGRFERWLMRRGVLSWPRTETGALNTEGDTFRMMSHIPGIVGIHALKDSLRVIANARLPIGTDKRNRPSLFPFGAATGRNRHSKSLFNAHAGMRSFMVFPPDKIGAYIDWRTQEIGLAADLSGDPALIDAYLSGDIYHALARMCGLTDDENAVSWGKQNPAVRQQMKKIQLGINYGMGVASLARGINRHPLIGAEIIDRYKRTYPKFWKWRTEMVETAMLERRIESLFGWTLRISTSPNPRALLNFPMQAGGADMLRLATMRLCDAGLVPSMLVHDAILLEADSLEQVEHAKEIMRTAGRDTCNGLDIGANVDQLLQGGARFRDKRPDAVKMWNTIMGVLAEVGAVPREENAA